MIGASAHFVIKCGSEVEGYPLPSSRLGSSCSRCAPAATNPKVYAEHYAARAAACMGRHIDSPQELPHNICNPVVPLLVALYDPRWQTGMGILYPLDQGALVRVICV